MDEEQRTGELSSKKANSNHVQRHQKRGARKNRALGIVLTVLVRLHLDAFSRDFSQTMVIRCITKLYLTA